MADQRLASSYRSSGPPGYNEGVQRAAFLAVPWPARSEVLLGDIHPAELGGKQCPV